MNARHAVLVLLLAVLLCWAPARAQVLQTGGQYVQYLSTDIVHGAACAYGESALYASLTSRTLGRCTSETWDTSVSGLRAAEVTEAPGNRLRVIDNDTDLTPDPSCANSCEAGYACMLDVDESATHDYVLCEGTTEVLDLTQAVEFGDSAHAPVLYYDGADSCTTRCAAAGASECADAWTLGGTVRGCADTTDEKKLCACY